MSVDSMMSALVGLAPVVIHEIYAAVPALCAEGMTLVVVEQDVTLAQDTISTSFQINVSGNASAGTANITAETVGTDANIAVLTIDDLGT